MSLKNFFKLALSSYKNHYSPFVIQLIVSKGEFHLFYMQVNIVLNSELIEVYNSDTAL